MPKHYIPWSDILNLDLEVIKSRFTEPDKLTEAVYLLHCQCTGSIELIQRSNKTGYRGSGKLKGLLHGSDSRGKRKELEDLCSKRRN